MSTPTTGERMTAAEFMKKYGHCSGVELVRGRVVWAGQDDPTAIRGGRVPHFKHGVVCQRASRLIGNFVDEHKLGWVATNDTFVPVRSDGEDSVRGADVLFISYTRLPPGDTPEVLEQVPDLVVEVRSPSDRSGDVRIKVGEYQNAGVTVVVVLDPAIDAATVYRADEEIPQRFSNGDELTLPDVLPGFAVPVRAFFG